VPHVVLRSAQRLHRDGQYAVTAFAGRQELYEYYFFGDPVRMAGALVRGYDREPYKARVRRFIDG